MKGVIQRGEENSPGPWFKRIEGLAAAAAAVASGAKRAEEEAMTYGNR